MVRQTQAQSHRRVSGRVRIGFGRDKGGIRTANVAVDVPFGVYTVATRYGCGVAASTPARPGVLEVHVIALDRDIYGEDLEVMILREIPRGFLAGILAGFGMEATTD